MMKNEVQNRLLQINQQFYNCYASSFSSTRNQVQPGVGRFVDHMDRTASILDVGCGNGTLARSLAARELAGRYLGLDMSESLLEDAAKGLEGSETGAYQFQQADLADQDWVETIPDGPYDWLVAFAVLHHIPGEGLRKRIVADFARLISSASQVAVSVWQWHNSARLQKRVLPWSEVGLNPDELDPGDVLLDWRAGDTIGLRYVHTFDERELTELAQSTGFLVQQSFYSDGKTGNMALYQVWQPGD